MLFRSGADPITARQAYRRFVRAGVDATSPWEALRGQVYLGEDKFLARMEGLAAEQDKQGIPSSHRQPTRPDAEAVLAAVAKAFGVTPEQIQNRHHQRAFQAWVYLLRRAVNLSLREVAGKAGVSSGRISQIQRAIEAGEPEPAMARLKRRYKVKA